MKREKVVPLIGKKGLTFIMNRNGEVAPLNVNVPVLLDVGEEYFYWSDLNLGLKRDKLGEVQKVIYDEKVRHEIA